MSNPETASPDKIIRFKLPSSRQIVIQELTERWVAAGKFRVGVWDATTKDPTYKIRSHPTFNGKFIPNNKVSSMVEQGQKIWQTFHSEPLQKGESYRDYFRILTPRKKRR